MGQFMLTGIGSIFSSTIEWFTGLVSKGGRGVKKESNGTEIYGTPPPVRLHCQPQEKDVPEELVCNPDESRFNPYHYKPTSIVNFSKNPRNEKVRTHFKQRHSIHNVAQNHIVHDPNASESNPISVKATKDDYVEKYMNNGLYEEELVAVLRKQLPFDDFHGMILIDAVRNQTKNGSYLIRSSTENKEIDHCTAMILENDYKEYFDPSGELPLNLKNFFTEYNRRQLQSSIYNTCGFHCTHYLIARHNRLRMDQFIASYPGNLQENDKMVTENFIELHDHSRIIVENQE